RGARSVKDKPVGRRYRAVLDRSCAPRSADARVGTKEWALQVEQKNGRKCKGGREIGLDSAPIEPPVDAGYTSATDRRSLCASITTGRHSNDDKARSDLPR